MSVPMELHKIIISEMQDKQLIWLKEVDGERKFMIVIGSPEAMAIDRRLDGIDLCSRTPLWLASEVRPPGRVATSTRIGISKETTRLLRFYEAGNPHVSGPSALRK